MALYEMVREIENECANNRMRDVFFLEVETDDPVSYVRTLLKDEQSPAIEARIIDHEEMEVLANCSGVVQKFVFTRI